MRHMHMDPGLAAPPFPPLALGDPVWTLEYTATIGLAMCLLACAHACSRIRREAAPLPEVILLEAGAPGVVLVEEETEESDGKTSSSVCPGTALPEELPSYSMVMGTLTKP